MRQGVVAVVLILALATAGAVTWRYLHHDSGGARLAEATAIEAKGGVVEIPEDQAALIAEVAMLRAKIRDLDEALDTAEKAAPGAKPITIIRASTGPLQCTVPPPQALPVAVPSKPCPACVIATDEHPEIKVDAVELETKAGNTVLSGAAGVYVGDDRRFGGPFSAPLTNVHEVDTDTQAGWPTWKVAVVAVGSALAAGVLVAVVSR